MKKTLLLITIVLSTLSGYAQTEKGKKMIGGQFNISGSNTSSVDTLNSSKSNNFNTQINPSFGYFVKDNFAIGVVASFGLANSTQKSMYPDYTSKIKTISAGVGGFARYYKKITDKFFLFGNASLMYIYGIYETKYPGVSPTQQTESNSINFAIAPGLVYFPTSKLGIETSFGKLYYNQSISKNKTVSYYNHVSSSSYGISLSPSYIYLGMNYYF